MAHYDPDITWEDVKKLLPRAVARAQKKFYASKDGMSLGVDTGNVSVFVSLEVATYRAWAVAREAAKDHKEQLDKVSASYSEKLSHLRKELGEARRERDEAQQARASLAVRHEIRGQTLLALKADTNAVNKRLKELYLENDKLKEQLKGYKGTDKCLSSCKREILVKENEQLRQTVDKLRYADSVKQIKLRQATLEKDEAIGALKAIGNQVRKVLGG